MTKRATERDEPQGARNHGKELLDHGIHALPFTSRRCVPMSDPVSFRELRADETDAAARIHRAAMEGFAWYDSGLHTPEEDRQFYRNTVFVEDTIFGAFDGDDLLGHAAWKAGWIDHLYVDPPHQSKGIGGALLDRVKSENTELELWTFQSNTGARRFYEKYGFAVQEFTDGAGNEEQLPDVRYRWQRS